MTCLMSAREGLFDVAAGLYSAEVYEPELPALPLSLFDFPVAISLRRPQEPVHPLEEEPERWDGLS